MKENAMLSGPGLRVVILLGITASLASGQSQERNLKTRLFEFTYTATIERVPEGAETVHLWVPYPQTDQNQEILDIKIHAPEGAAVNREPRYANLMLHVSSNGAHTNPLQVSVRFKVLRREYVRRGFGEVGNGSGPSLPGEVRKFLQPYNLVPINDQIRTWAQEVTRGKETDLEKARAIYDYVLAHVKYDKTGRGWGRGDLLYVCDARRGNCTDFHALFNGFARAVGIPARFSIGFPLPAQRGEGEIPGYHCWSEFYLKGLGWVPIDASEGWKNPERREYFFGAHDENRVQFSTGRDIILQPRQANGPINYFIYPYAEADGKILEEISFQFYFKDLPVAAAAQAGH